MPPRQQNRRTKKEKQKIEIGARFPGRQHFVLSPQSDPPFKPLSLLLYSMEGGGLLHHVVDSCRLVQRFVYILTKFKIPI